MILTFTDRRFEAIASYMERDLCKRQGLRWDPTRKRWWTPDWQTAAKLSGYCDEKARAELERHHTRAEHTLDASRAVDADIEVPVPEGLSYLPFQKAGIAYALRKFGDMP